jgi:hypothetical protein
MNTGLIELVVRALESSGIDLRVEGGEPRTGIVTAAGALAGPFDVHVTTRTIDKVAAATMRLPDERPLLLLAPLVLPAAAEVLRSAREVQFADAAGNCWLTGPGLHVDVRGRRLDEESAARVALAAPRAHTAPARAFTPAGVRVLLPILSRPRGLHLSVRDLAMSVGVSVGTAHAVLDYLADAGYTYEHDGLLAVRRGGELLDRFAEAYASRVHHKLTMGRFAPAGSGDVLDIVREVVSEAAVGEVVLGGEAAAALLDLEFRNEDLSVYLTREQVEEVLRRWRLRPEEDGPIELRERFWQPAAVGPARAGLAPSPLVYADLRASGEPRQVEAADKLRRTDAGMVDLDGR